MEYFKKIHHIVQRFSGLVGNYPKTFLFFVRRKIFGKAKTSASYKGIKFSFRYEDLSAVEETLVRGEYNFLVPTIASAKNPVIVDIGMNIGDFAVMALAHNQNARIIGIEANPETADFARINSQLNPGKKWDVHNLAAWKNCETIYLESSEASVSSKIAANGKIAVKATDMRSLWTLLPEQKADIMKIDIEGAEEEFLFSSPEYMHNIDHLVVEIHPLACDETKIRTLLAQYFTTVEDVGGRISSKPLLHCRRA